MCVHTSCWVFAVLQHTTDDRGAGRLRHNSCIVWRYEAFYAELGYFFSF